MANKGTEAYDHLGKLLNSHTSSEKFKKLLETHDFGFRNPAELFDIYNKLKSSNKEGITQEEYHLFEEFLAHSEAEEKLLEAFDEMMRKKLKATVDIKTFIYQLLVESRAMNVLSSEQKHPWAQVDLFGKQYRKIRDGWGKTNSTRWKNNALYVNVYDNNNGYSVGYSLRTRDFVLIDDEKNESIFESNTQIRFEKDAFRQSFYILFSTWDKNYVVLNNHITPLSKNVILLQDWNRKIIVDAKWGTIFLHYMNDPTQSLYTKVLEWAKVEKLSQEFWMMIVHDRSVASSDSNYQLYDIFKRKVVENYLDPKTSGFNEEGFVWKTVDGKYYLEYSSEERELTHQKLQ